LNGPNLTSESTGGAYTKGTTNFSKARCFLRSFNLSMSSGVIVIVVIALCVVSSSSSSSRGVLSVAFAARRNDEKEKE